MKPHDPNKTNLKLVTPPGAPEQILQRADLVWSRMKLEAGEVLLIKMGEHLRPVQNDVKAMVDHIFKREGDRVLLYFEGDLEFIKFEPTSGL